ncbi:A-kinase anchor protein 13 isoform X4 [Denticeps clupeoides]|uniref:A-kinase anchor protein 13 isoform X4 n=1 Tax=Denticeps clupeoides TaxID=299321 RepID=UPI0010A3A223|nr:A-kinase anchor protein 13-like isoform X4 [Denticeps clupeoides]
MFYPPGGAIEYRSAVKLPDMKLSPKQAPLYGECVLTVQLAEEDVLEAEEEVEFYLLFSGSTQRHLASTLRLSQVTLQAICPAHDRGESVQVTLCLARSSGSVVTVAEDRFHFVQDLAWDMAQFLVKAAGNQEGALLLEECEIPLQECERLDRKLATALRHITLPQGWSVLGVSLNTEESMCHNTSVDPGPYQTLLHFAARRGWREVALFLLEHPAGWEALRLPNRQGRTPAGEAESHGHNHLHKLLSTDMDIISVQPRRRKEHWLFPGGRALLQHHPRLNTYTLTLNAEPGSPPPSLQSEVEQFQKLIRCHQDGELETLHPVTGNNVIIPDDQICLPCPPPSCGSVERETQQGGSAPNQETNHAGQRNAEGHAVIRENSGTISTKQEGDTDRPIREEQTNHSDGEKRKRGEDRVFDRADIIMGHAHSQEELKGGSVPSHHKQRAEEPGVDCTGSQGIDLHCATFPTLMDCQHTDRNIDEEPEENGRDGAMSFREMEGLQAVAGCLEKIKEEECLVASSSPRQEPDELEKPHPAETMDHSTLSVMKKAPLDPETKAEQKAENIIRGASPQNLPVQKQHRPTVENIQHLQDGADSGSKDSELTEADVTRNEEQSAGMSSESHKEPCLTDSAPRTQTQELGHWPPESPQQSTGGFSDDLQHLTEKQESPITENVEEKNEDKPWSSAIQDNALHAETGTVEPMKLTETSLVESVDLSPTTRTEIEELIELITVESAGQSESSACVDHSNISTAAKAKPTDQPHPIKRTSSRGRESIIPPGTGAEDLTEPLGQFETNSFTPTDHLEISMTELVVQPEVNTETLLETTHIALTDQSVTSKGDLLELNEVSITEPSDLANSCTAGLIEQQECSTESHIEPLVQPHSIAENAVEVTCTLDPMNHLETSPSESVEMTQNAQLNKPKNSTDQTVPSWVRPGAEDVARDSRDELVLESIIQLHLDGAIRQGDVKSSPEVSQSHGSCEPNPPSDVGRPVEELTSSRNTFSFGEQGGIPVLGEETQVSSRVVDGDSSTLFALLPTPSRADADLDKTFEGSCQRDDPVGPHETMETSDTVNDLEDGGPVDQKALGSVDMIQREESCFSYLEQDGPTENCDVLGCPAPQSDSLLDSAILGTEDKTSNSSMDISEDTIFRKEGELSVAGSTSGVSVYCSGPGPRPSVDSCESCVPGCSVGGAEVEEERKDSMPGVQPCLRSASAHRRHSWGPGKGHGTESEMVQRSSVHGQGRGRPTGHRRSFSLEGLVLEQDGGRSSPPRRGNGGRGNRLDNEDRGSLVSLTEEEQESEVGDGSSLDSQQNSAPVQQRCASMPSVLTKSVSMLAISPHDLDVIGRAQPKRRISFSFSVSPLLPKSKTVFSIGSSSSDEDEAVKLRSFSVTSGTQVNRISEENPGPLRVDSEGRAGTKVSRTISYLKNKMTKKSREKEKDKEPKEKRASNGHQFGIISVVPSTPCDQCTKPMNIKDTFFCTNCSAHVHKACRETLPLCAKVKVKQKTCSVPDSIPMRSKTMSQRDRPWSTISISDEQNTAVMSRWNTSSFMGFSSSNLSKSMSISNIAGPTLEDTPLKRFLSQSTDSLHKSCRVNQSTESLSDEGTEVMDSQLMGEFEADARYLEADSWSLTVDKKTLKHLKKDVVKRQDVIYELIQTELHHVRTLRIMGEVYSKGLQRELQLEPATLQKLFPVLDELLDLHSRFLSSLLRCRKEAHLGPHTNQDHSARRTCGFLVQKIGDTLISQFSGSNAERLKKFYGKFCSRHSDAVNLYKELHNKDKHFQAFIKKKMSSSIVRRLSIPECILLVTQRITKYPVLIQRILQLTKESEEDHSEVTEALRLVKDVIVAVDNNVNEHEKKRRQKEVYGRTDSKSITRMKSGQMFAREDLLRGRRLLHDGVLQLKSATGRLKDVHALLLSDVIVFLQEKDQKYIFASLDQRATVISLQKLMVREVANEEKALFLITQDNKPEMVEVHANSREERNVWKQQIQSTIQSFEKNEHEGIPSESEEEKRAQEAKAQEMRDLLHKKDELIVALLEEKVKIFREMCRCGTTEPIISCLRSRMLFRATSADITKGEPIMKEALREVDILQRLVNRNVGGALGPQTRPSPGPASLPRRAETFGGFDSHILSSCKNGEKEGVEEPSDLRRTESDGVLKAGASSLVKRNSEQQLLGSVIHLHDLLITLQAVVVQQDSFIEDQRQALQELPSSSCRHPSISSTSSSSSSSSSPARLRALEAEVATRREQVEAEQRELLLRREEYQRDLEQLSAGWRKLEQEREQLQHQSLHPTDEEHVKDLHPSVPLLDPEVLRTSESLEQIASVDAGMSTLLQPMLALTKDLPSRMNSKKRKGKTLIPFSSSSQSSEATSGQITGRLLQLDKPKDKKDKKKKKGRAQPSQTTDPHSGPGQPAGGDIFFC